MADPDRRRDRGGLVLVAGATGYIGGRLVPLLLRRGERLRCLARDPGRLAGRGWPGVEVVAGDVLAERSLAGALQGVHTARHLVYLDGPGSRPVSSHLASCQETGRILRATGLPATDRALDPAERRPATVWSGALASGEDRTAPPGSLEPASGTVRERLEVRAAGPPETFAVLAGLGGRRGWLYGHWLWWLGGAVDRVAGGVGLRRGRRDPDTLRPGDALDGWRLEEVSAPRLLRLRREMRMPGRAWLEWEVTLDGEGGSIVARTAWFEPRGLPGRLCRRALLPVHRPMFRGMLRAAARRAEAPAGARAGRLPAGHAPERAWSPPRP